MSDTSLSDSPEGSTQIQQQVTGDRNQTNAQISGGTVIGTVETLNQISQQLPRDPEAARYSLPGDVAEFTGRETEMEQIAADLQGGWVVAIAGMAGVGKSALAVRVAHRLKAQFPGGQIYLNLRGADSQPMTLEAALESLLRALGVDPAQIPPDRAEQAALYRSRMAQAPTLVLLDNAAHTQPIAELLPGSGACLLTSRRQLDGLAGVKHHNLAALPAPKALELLQKLLPPARIQAEAAAAEQLVGYCGRLPLAVRIAAATLGKRSWQGRSLADYAQQLADERQRLDHLKLADLDVRASFELSYRELAPEVAHLLGWLGLLPADFGTAILSPLTQQPDETVQPALAELVDGRLVDPLAGSRYILHDLMRLFALEKLHSRTEPAIRLASQARLVDWCAEQAGIWNQVLDPTQRRQWAETLATAADPTAAWEPRLLQAALTWFEAERPTLVSAFTWAAATQQHPQSVALAANLGRFFGLRGYWGDWVTNHQQALTAARQAGDQWGAGQTLNNLGMVYKAQSQWQQAIDCYQQSLHIFRAIGDVQGEGASLNNLGAVYQDQGNWQQAIDCYQQSLEIFREIGNVQGEGQSLGNLGNMYQDQGNWQQAINCYQQSLQILRAVGDIHGEGKSLGNLGNVYQDQGNWQQAIDCYQQSLEIFREIGDVQGEGKSIMGLGNVYQDQGKWQQAIDYYQQSLEIKRAIGDVRGEGQTLNNLGIVYQDQGKWQQAIYCYQQSLEIKRAIGDVQGEGQTLANLGFLHQKQGQAIQAVQYWQAAIEKLHPDSPEYRRVYALVYPNQKTIVTSIGILGLGVVALVFVVSNLLAGRWWIALAIIVVAVVAFWLLRAILYRRS